MNLKIQFSLILLLAVGLLCTFEMAVLGLTTFLQSCLSAMVEFAISVATNLLS